MKFRKKFAILRRLLGLILIVVLVVVIINHQTVFDFVRGLFYTPSSEMIEIRHNLELTEKGLLIFNASRPELNNENDFNVNCLSFNEKEAILGCYKNQKIYIYTINSEELAGIMELATAHELLHAFYERISAQEKNNLRELLEVIYKNNQIILGDEIESYDVNEQLEEIYVRVGTEIKELPETLEKHYAIIFKDQDKIVNYYEKYIGVFRQLETELKVLETEMEELENQINEKSKEYKIRSERLSNDINNFNNCANQIGCFKNENEFILNRNKLINDQVKLKALYDEIDILINQYNLRVKKYNNNIVRNKNLQNIINSHVIVEGM